jgi:hypothetical protein
MAMKTKIDTMKITRRKNASSSFVCSLTEGLEVMERSLPRVCENYDSVRGLFNAWSRNPSILSLVRTVRYPDCPLEAAKSPAVVASLKDAEVSNSIK